MGWSGPMPNAEGRMVGYAVEAVCDKAGCDEKIDRGLYFVCGEMHDGNEYSCGGYFCGEHLVLGIGIPNQMCEECAERYERENPEQHEAAIRAWEAGVVDDGRGELDFSDAPPKERRDG